MQSAVFSGIALSAAAGLNAFLPLLIVAIADRASSSFDLGRPYDFISSTAGILIILSLLTIEVIVDKIPRVDHVNDLIQSAIRPAAGAVLFMAVISQDDELHPLIAMVLGLVIAGAVHWYKTMSRPAITIETRGLGNPIVSMVEDGLSGLTAIAAVAVPFVGFLVAGASGWVLRKTYRRFQRPRQTADRTVAQAD